MHEHFMDSMAKCDHLFRFVKEKPNLGRISAHELLVIFKGISNIQNAAQVQQIMKDNNSMVELREALSAHAQSR